MSTDEGTDEQREREGGDEWEKCGSCGERYPDVYWADDAQWEKVVGDTFGGLRCPECFKREAWAMGLKPALTFLAPPLDHSLRGPAMSNGDALDRTLRYADQGADAIHRAIERAGPDGQGAIATADAWLLLRGYRSLRRRFEESPKITVREAPPLDLEWEL